MSKGWWGDNDDRYGTEDKAREIAANLKRSGVGIDIIAANTGLTEEEIRQL